MQRTHLEIIITKLYIYLMFVIYFLHKHLTIYNSLNTFLLLILYNILVPKGKKYLVYQRSRKEENNMKLRNTVLAVLSLSAVLALASCGGDQTADTGDTQSAGSSFDSSSAFTVVSREDGSGTRGAFTELFGIEEEDANGNTADLTTEEAIIANRTDVMLTNVAGDEYAIGYVSLGSLNDSVKAVDIDGAAATAENVQNGTYKVSRPFNIVTKDGLSDVAQDFINFIMSKEGQEICAGDYIPVDAEAAAFAGTNPSGRVTVVGSSSVSPLMEELKEAYQAVNPSAEIEIQTNDSTSGVNGAIEGTCDIGMASRELSDSEASQVTATAIAIDGIAVIVNSENPTDALTSQNVKDIFTGTITTWADIA